MSNYKQMKIRIRDRDHSAEVQKVLFKLGYRWRIDGMNIYHNVDARWLHTGVSNYNGITWAKYSTSHNDYHYYPDYTLEQLQQMLEQQEKNNMNTSDNNDSIPLNMDLSKLSETEKEMFQRLVSKGTTPTTESTPVQHYLACTEGLNVDDMYWHILSDGTVTCSRWDNDGIDNRTLSLGNVYKTRSDAELALEAKHFKQKLRVASSKSWGDVKVDWSNSDQDKYSINCVQGEYKVHVYGIIQRQYTFKTKEDAQSFIDDNKDDLCLLFVE